ncbi:MAG: DUF2065 domain-containing protein [Gammaproteobacteria bacterium]|nr:DUF2065 domain-containing protein [Gammaproteobacteria bacterium]
MQDLLTALALVLVIEGILPFVKPAKWRAIVVLVAQQSDSAIRKIGLISMLLGLVSVILIRAY